MRSYFSDQAKILCAALAIGAALAQPAQANLCRTSLTGMADYTQYPLFLNSNPPPVSMLALSIDHQLFNKAYTDYTNLDNDPEIETTYDGGVTYSGYFGSDFCYSYAGGIYTATANAINKKCTGQWSGNFLNWVTMTRLDVLRWVLYGGNRSVDTLTETVLERAHIPQDGHSYTKIFSGSPGVLMSDVTPFSHPSISICNTTSTAEESSTTTSPPVMQIANGRFPSWTLIERFQCDFGRGGGSPPNTANIGINNVRVKVCAPGFVEDFCRTYPNAGVPVNKPAGILQQYGEGVNGVEFGLVSGSYDRPRSGGVLRSNVGKVTTEIDQATGLFINQADGTQGIINTIRRIRSSQYRRDVWRDCGSPGIANSALTNTRGNTKCNMWGNPMSEIYAEALRYLAAQTPTAAFAANDGTPTGADPAYIPGMPIASWADPFANRPRCTACSIIVLSTGLNSFDRDEIPPVPALGALTIDQAVDAIGANEAVSGNILIGAVLGGATDTPAAANASARTCSAKVGTLSQLSGICPEVASLHGGYGIAGLAHRAYINDLRPTLEGIQVVRTYTLALGESLPSFEIPVNGQRITVLPFAQSTNAGAPIPETAWRASSIVNFQTGFLVGPKTAADLAVCTTVPVPARCNYFGVPTGNTETLGSYVINWEDSSWGNDYDQDGVQVISYCTGGSCTPEFCANTDATSYAATVPAANRACEPPFAFDPNKVYVRSEVVATAGSFSLRFGWITSGSDAPGTLPPTVANGNSNCNFLINPAGDFYCRANPATPTAPRWTRAAVRSYSPSDTGARLLENPLFYAAKYGSFTDINGDGVPNNNPGINNNPEWDNLNLRGESIPDGLPDSYFPVRNPNLLKQQLQSILERISSTQASGSSAAVVSASGGGNGAVFQASYSEEITDPTLASRKVKWVGSLRGLWVSNDGRLAEDTNQNGEYDDGGDLIISFEYDPISKTTKIRRAGLLLPLSELRPIWDALDVLSAMDSANLGANRSYSGELAQDKRYITTWLDANKNGRVEPSEQVPFEAGTALTVTNSAFLNTCSAGDASRLVNWVRGIDETTPPTAATPLRSRQIDLDGDGTVETARLGDIVNSSPLVIGKPSEATDFLYRDNSYTNFASRYRCRRTVVYAGGNDGMLHAFNAGFRSERGFSTVAPPGCGTSGTGHALGSELWGYVPGNLLPHLPWMTDRGYTHVFYVDGSPQAFEVKAFPPSNTHPDGWGTILVVPFRLGGGPIAVKTSGIAQPADFVSRPAYVIMDVTDPELPPRLLAEVVLPNNGTPSVPSGTLNRLASFSFGAPAIAFDISYTGTTTSYDYKLIFGSGPTTINPEVYSQQRANLFVYDLDDLIAQVGVPTRTLLPEANSSISDMNSADFDFGGTTDAVYFGTIEGAPISGGPSTDVNGGMTGSMYKLPIEALGGAGLSGAIQPGQVFALGQSPIVFFDPNRPIQGRPSLTVTPRRQGGIAFGTGRMLSKGDFSSTASNALYILDDIRTFAAFPFVGPLNTDPNDFRTENGARGLRISLPLAERAFTSPLVFRGIGVFTSFKPEPDQCLALGQSFLTQIDFANASASSPLGTTGQQRTALGDGASSDPRLIIPTRPVPPVTADPSTPPEPPTIGILVQDSTGRLTTTNSIDNDLDPFSEQSWFEPRDQ
jgi:type IV pilus assembly protein PilY1